MRRHQYGWAIRSLICLLLATGPAPLVAEDVIIAFPNGKTMRYGETRNHSITVYRARSKAQAPTVLLFGEARPRFGEANGSLHFLIAGLTDSGAAVVSINLPGKSLADDAANISRALAFVRSRASADRLDLSRIAIAGHRSGAHFATLVSTDPSYLESAGLPFQSVRGAAFLDGSLFDADAAMMPQAQVGAPNAPVFLMVHPKTAANRARVFGELAVELRKAGSPVVERTMVSGDGISDNSPSDRTIKEALVFLRNRFK